MNIIEPYISIEDIIDGIQMIKKIEKAGRTCYKSEDKISQYSGEKFVSAIIKRGHESVIEHEKITVRIVCDRGVTHELVRHRIASYSQESTRYCNYTGDKFGNQLTFIKPCFFNTDSTEDKLKYSIWENSLKDIEKNYFSLIEKGAKPEEARSILPNSLKTEIVVTMNLREWRHYLKLRTSKEAHPQIREISDKILIEFKKLVPVVFDDI